MQFLFKTFLKKQKKVIYSFILLLFSISFNQFYGYVGVFPLDSFIIFNSGYDLLNGYFPFKDYWTITGPMLDIIQAFFFKLFGVSWSSYVLHASFFNFIISFFTFYTLVKFKLNIHYSFFYSLLVSCLAYPIVGTPFMDHHSAILSIVSLFIFILAIQLKINLYWFFLPIILGCAFLSKQTPAAYTIIIITILSLIYFFNNFNRKKIIFFFLGMFVFTLFQDFNPLRLPRVIYNQDTGTIGVQRVKKIAFQYVKLYYRSLIDVDEPVPWCHMSAANACN